MEVKLYKPQSALLQRYIECFYTLKCQPESKDVRYIGFPSLYSMICMNNRADVKVTGNYSVSITHNSDKPIQTRLVRKFDSGGQVKYAGEADEIVIYFKPLGLNAFLEYDLKYYKNNYFVEFNPFEDFKGRMAAIFLIDNEENRIQALENYWLCKFRGFKHPFLNQVIEKIMDENESFSISRIALENGVSRPTLVKHFMLQIGTTPAKFKKIVRFRNAMKRYRLKISEENLSDISYDATYFDQSHMIKDFKTLTNLSPKNFFSQISTLEDGQINWLFL